MEKYVSELSVKSRTSSSYQYSTRVANYAGCADLGKRVCVNFVGKV